MPTEVLRVDPQSPDPAVIERAADVIRRGGLVAFPTETVYGLGADATSPAAVRRIFEAKGRPATNPTIIHVADDVAAKLCAAEWPPTADVLANKFWPGPLTIVVPAASRVAPAALAGGTTVGLRVPMHPVALALLKAAGRPIAAPSANRSESLSPTRAEHVLQTLEGRVELILDAGPTSGGIESTVVDLSVEPPRVLRPGLVGADRLTESLPALEVSARTDPDTGARAADATRMQKAPGGFPRHYAPATPLEIVADLSGRLEAVGGLSVGVVEFGDALSVASSGRIVFRRLPRDAAGAARELYAVLHELDAMGLDRLLVAEPPGGDDWSAIRDRLQRASTPPTP